MKVFFTSSFEKDLKKVRENALREGVRKIILCFEEANHIGEIAGLKKLKTGASYFRLRIGDYRLGLSIQNNEVKFIRFLHRSDIYRFFP